MYKFIAFGFLTILLGTSCTNPPSEQPPKTNAPEGLTHFLKKFPELELPYKMMTDPTNTSSNHTVLTDLLAENYEIDTLEIADFELNTSIGELDSLREDSVMISKFKFYALGKVYDKDHRTALLYGRADAETEENFTVFLATYDETGHKVDEVIFHRPLHLLPPRDLRRISEIGIDSVIKLVQIHEEHKLVNDDEEYMKLESQTAHELSYSLLADGKIKLNEESDRKLTAKEIQEARTTDSLRQIETEANSDSSQNIGSTK